MCILCHNVFGFLFSFVFMQSLDGISDIRDESDRSGMRVVIEVKYIHMSLVLIPIFSCLMTYAWKEKNPNEKDTIRC